MEGGDAQGGCLRGVPGGVLAEGGDYAGGGARRGGGNMPRGVGACPGGWPGGVKFLLKDVCGMVCGGCWWWQ